LAINPETDEMHGIVEKKGKNGEPKPYKIKQNKDVNQGLATAEEEVIDLEAIPDFHCDVAEQVLGEMDVNEREEERMNEREEVGRKLGSDLRGGGKQVRSCTV
jgi:hypothetical protein